MARLDSITDITMTFDYPLVVKFFGPAFLRPFNESNMTEYIERKLKEELLQGEAAQERRVGRIQDITLRVTTSLKQYVDHKMKVNAAELKKQNDDVKKQNVELKKQLKEQMTIMQTLLERTHA